MSIPIRSLVDTLWDQVGPEPVDRLCALRGVGARSRPAKCEALVRAYAEQHDVFLADLRKSDLVALLADPTSFDGRIYYLPYARSHPRDELLRIATQAFAQDTLPAEFVRLDRDAEADLEQETFTEALDDDDWDEDDGPADDHRGYRAEAYARRFYAALQPVPSAPPRGYQQEAVDAIWTSLEPAARSLLHVATGGGKTFIANDVVARWLDERSGRVLWMTKAWGLLHQAAGDLSRRHGRADQLGRLGGDGSVIHPLPEWEAPVTYTTIHTLHARLERPDALLDVGLVVWDESHWGESGDTGRAILRGLTERRVPVLGLTATARERGAAGYKIVFSRTFAELVDGGFLARPVSQEPVRTGVTWNAKRTRGIGDFTRGSLQELARKKKRNQLIVDHYVMNAPRYGRAIVFACTVEHANVLARMFEARGIPARAIHSHNEDAQNGLYLDEFRRGSVSILVNVEMLTHGVDVPSARTVFLARPTTSDILYAQMVGRASRLDPATNKTTFHLVEFTDNLERFGQDLIRGKVFFSGGAGGPVLPPPAVPQAPAAVRPRHRFDPQGGTAWIPDDPSLPEPARGLWYRKGQTFGLEIELTQDGIDPESIAGTEEWWTVANALLVALRRRLSHVAERAYEDYQGFAGGKSHEVWNVEYDSTVGWEVTSRVLEGEEGFIEVARACEAIESVARQYKLNVSAKTGLHLHVGWKDQSDEELRNLIRLVRLFEPALATLVAPSRIAKWHGGGYQVGLANEYCRPISTVIPASALALPFDRARIGELLEDRSTRYATVNLVPLFEPGAPSTVEVRMHSGTMDARKMLLWTSLWQQILWAARHPKAMAEMEDAVYLEPVGDIVALSRVYLPEALQPQQQAFTARLAQRRAEIVAEWQKHPELQPWADFANRWGRSRWTT